MSIYWAERQRNTNRLARILANYLFSQSDQLTAKQLYGLSKLSWITDSYDGEKAGYIFSTKIPALADIVGSDFTNQSLEEVAEKVSKEVVKKVSSIDEQSLCELIKGHSGFTNFYKAYRKSVFKWIEKNIDKLNILYKDAYSSKSDEDRLKIVDDLTKLPGIPKTNHSAQLMKPEYFLTPVFFMLDQDIKFPIINGSKHVRSLLKKLKVTDLKLTSQYRALIEMYGVGGIKDAADLDQLRKDLIDFLSIDGRAATKKLLEEKSILIDSELSFKDEKDVESIKEAGTVVQRRIHNQLTNKLREILKKFTLYEGTNESCMYDVLVKKFDGKSHDLLIEVKSSTEIPHIRMAVGQLFYYHYRYPLKGNDEKPLLAILLPERPAQEIEGFLKAIDVGLLWLDSNKLCTVNDWLRNIAYKN